MTPRPMYRWKSFWLGLLVLAGLGWAWAHSMRQGERILMEGGYLQASSVAVVGGSFSVSTQFVWGGAPLRMNRFSWPAAQYPDKSAWAFREWDQPSLMMRWIAFPLWVPTAAGFVLWSGWLVWRWRKIRRSAG